MACALSTPTKAEATAIITFKILSQVVFFILKLVISGLRSLSFFNFFISKDDGFRNYPKGFSSRPPELPPELPPSDEPPSLSSNFSKAKVTFAGLLVCAWLLFTSFSSLSGTKRIFTRLIFYTVHSPEVATPGQQTVM